MNHVKELSAKWIGQKVTKTSRKPFKFGEKVGTVEEVSPSHPNKNDVISFRIMEDGTFVEAWRCRNVATNELGPRNFEELQSQKPSHTQKK